MDELPVVCNRGTFPPRASKRQVELWSLVSSEVEERRELDNGYALKLPAERLAEAAELMDIERRCCGFLSLRLEAHASEPHVWFTLSGPPGTKAVLEAELALMLNSSQHHP